MFQGVDGLEARALAQVAVHGCVRLLLALEPDIGADDNREGGADIECAFHIYLTAHLIDDLLAYAETESSARRVDLLVLLQFAEVNEQVLNVLSRNTDSLVFNLE